MSGSLACLAHGLGHLEGLEWLRLSVKSGQRIGKGLDALGAALAGLQSLRHLELDLYNCQERGDHCLASIGAVLGFLPSNVLWWTWAHVSSEQVSDAG